MPRLSLIQPRRGTAAEWTAANPILAEGEEGLETDTDQSKRGDGVTAWTALPYVGKWDTIPGKPAVVAEGATQADARAAVAAQELTYEISGAVADGAADARTAIASADTAALSSGRAIQLKPGIHRIGSNLTVSSPVQFQPGAKIKPDSGVTVTLRGGVVSAPDSQIFDVSAGGVVNPKSSKPLSVAWWGVLGDGVYSTGAASTTAASAILTVTGANFSNNDVGKVVTVFGAGTSGAPLNSTIQSVQSSTQVTLADSAGASATNRDVLYGKDDTSALQAALNTGKPLFLPTGVYIITSGVVPGNSDHALVTPTNYSAIAGSGRNRTFIYHRPINVGETRKALHLRGGQISNLTIDGMHVPVTDIVQNDLSSSTLILSSSASADNVAITRSRASNIYGASGSTVTNCVLDKYGDHAFYVSQDAVAGQAPIINIFVRGCTITEDPNYHDLYSGNRGAVKIRDNVEHVVISDNIIEADSCVLITGKNDIAEAIPSGIIVTGNILKTFYAGVYVETVNAATPVDSLRVTDVTISGNHIEGRSSGEGFGVALMLASAVVSGNTFDGLQSGLNDNGAATSGVTPPWEVKGNTFRDLSTAIYKPSVGSIISGNSISSCDTGIYNHSWPIIQDNYFTNCTTVAVRLNMSGHATNRAAVLGNTFVGNALALDFTSTARSYTVCNNVFINNTALATVGHGSTFNSAIIEDNRYVSGARWPATSTDSIALTAPERFSIDVAAGRLSTIRSSGADTNIGLNILTKGTGPATVNSNGIGTWSKATVTEAVTLGAVANHEYVILIGASGAPTLPTAVGNGSKYRFRNVDTTDKSVATTSAQTVDGVAAPLVVTPGSAVELISDGSNWVSI